MLDVVVAVHDVVVRRGASRLVDGVSLAVAAGGHTVLLGPNGSGKTTVLRLLTGHLHPTTGTVEVLGERLGRTDVRALRQRVALVSTGLDDLVEPRHRCDAIVAAALDGATLPWRGHLEDGPERRRAREVLARLGADHVADRPLATCSQGERQKVRLARALIVEPELLLLDEPFAGLDLGGREDLLHQVERLLAGPDAPTVLLVTHRLEEVPGGIAHAVVLDHGRVVAAGAADRVLTGEVLGPVFGLPLDVVTVRGRRLAVAATGATSP